MSALGHKRTFAVHQRMSAFPLKADIRQRVATPLTPCCSDLLRVL
jgi:hypothetical protein